MLLVTKYISFLKEEKKDYMDSKGIRKKLKGNEK